jgi:hypothetical protein
MHAKANGKSGQPQTPPALPPRKDCGTHQIRGWENVKAGPDAAGKREISCPYQELNHMSFVIQLVT